MKNLQAILLVLMLAWLTAPVALATGTGNDSIPDYTGILTTTGGSLPTVPVQGDFVVNDASTRNPLSGTYRVGFKLIQADDNPASAEVFSPAFTVSLAPRTSTNGTKKVVLSPANLTAGAPYRVLAQLYTTGPTPGSWVPAGFTSTSDEYRFALVEAGTDSGVVAQLNAVTVTRAFAVVTAPASDSFQVSVQGIVGRLDQANQPVSTEDDQIFFDVGITGDHTGVIPLASPRTTLPVILANHTAGGAAAAVGIDQTLEIHPVAQMDPTDSYTLAVTMSHARPDGAEVMDRQVVLTAQRFLHFNGTLKFGPVATTVTAIYNDPDFEGTVAGTGENTALGIDTAGAHLNANPAYTISGQNFHVLLGLDGTATSADPATVDSPTGAAPPLAGVPFTLGEVTLDSTGAHATGGRVGFPAGFGVATESDFRRLMSDFPFGQVDLDLSMNPVGVVALVPGLVDPQQNQLYAAHEDLPEQFAASSISWDTAAGTFTLHRTGTRHVRADETAALDALALTPETLVAKIRPSNDGYLAAPGSGAGVDVVVRADAQGRAILDDATIDLPPSQFTPHFPADATIAWSQAGQLVIKAGLIDTAHSTLEGAAPALFNTLPGAPGLTLVGGLESFTFQPTNSSWHITADGGLHAEGAFTDGTVRWGARSDGAFVQTAGTFTTGAAEVPGNMLRGTLAAAPTDLRPGELLLSGHGKPSDETYVERPFTPAYAAGFADYPGLNVRPAGGGAETATSLLGDASFGPYPLAAAAKYYFRKAGASGIQMADRAYFAGGSISLQMYGFALALTDYQLAYRDNRVVDSLVAGTVNVPGARGLAGFEQPFSKLFLDPQGEPGEMTLPQNGSLQHPLAYWHARFHPLSAEFVASTSGPKTEALVFGAEVLLPAVVKDPVRGGLGFLPDGRLVAAKDGIPGVNSRMKPPKSVALHGPGSAGNSTIPGFTVNPVTDFYFNDPAAAGAPDDGFVAFAGTIDVPFFQDLKVHVLARADTGKTAIRAGWSTVRAGWPNGSSDFFNDRNYDSDNLGFPAGAGYDAYVNGAEPANFLYFDESDPAHNQRNLYNPIARQTWLGGVNFALPLLWDSALRRFVSSVPEQRQFLVMTSERAIQQLTPSGAEIRFGLQFNKLPRVNLTSLFIDDREATQALIKIIPDGPKLAAAGAAFDQLLDGNSDKLVADGVDLIIDQFLDYLLASDGPLKGLTASADAANAIGAPNTASFAAIRDQLKDKLSGVVGVVGQANSIAGQVADALDTVDQGLTTADTLLKKDADGNRGEFITDSVNLAGSFGLPTDAIQPVTDTITTEINGELAPTLDDIASTLDDIHSLAKSARSLADDAREVTQGALTAVNTAGALPDQILTALHDHLAQAHDPTGRLLAETDPAQLRADLKRAARDVVMQSDFLAQIQQTVRDLVEPLHDEFGVMYEQVFGVMNNVVRSAFEELSNQVVDHLNDQVGQLNRAYGGFSKTLEMTKIEGSAQILGEVLDNAHLNATLGLHVPDNVTLTGSVDFKHLQGTQPVPPSTMGTPDGRMQITVTARGDASIGGCQAAHAELHGQYTMSAKGEPLALSGGLDLEANPIVLGNPTAIQRVAVVDDPGAAAGPALHVQVPGDGSYGTNWWFAVRAVHASPPGGAKLVSSLSPPALGALRSTAAPPAPDPSSFTKPVIDCLRVACIVDQPPAAEVADTALDGSAVAYIARCRRQPGIGAAHFLVKNLDDGSTVVPETVVVFPPDEDVVELDWTLPLSKVGANLQVSCAAEVLGTHLSDWATSAHAGVAPGGNQRMAYAFLAGAIAESERKALPAGDRLFGGLTPGCSADWPANTHLVVSPGTGLILHPSFNVPLGAKARQYRVYRRIENGPMTLIAQGLHDYTGPGSTVACEDSAPPVSNGRVHYFSQFLDENGSPSTMHLLARLTFTGDAPPVPVLLTPTAADFSGTLAAPAVTLSWVEPPEHAERFEIYFATEALPRDTTPQVSSLVAHLNQQLNPTPVVWKVHDRLAGTARLVLPLQQSFLTGRVGGDLGPGPRFTVTMGVNPSLKYRVWMRALGPGGEPSDQSRVVEFQWQPPSAPPANIAWPARPLPPVAAFNAGIQAVDFRDVPDARLFWGYSQNGDVQIPLRSVGVDSTPVGIRVGSLAIDNDGARANFDPNPPHGPIFRTPSFSTTFGKADPNKQLFTREGDSKQLFLPCVLYRTQVPNGRFPAVSGDVIQCSPLINSIAWVSFPSDGNGSAGELADPLFRWVGPDYPTTPVLDLYLVDTQPAVQGARYRYWLVRFSDLGEPIQTVPCGEVTVKSP